MNCWLWPLCGWFIVFMIMSRVKHNIIYYCFMWWCLRCLDTFVQIFNSKKGIVFKTHVNDLNLISMKSLAKFDPHDDTSMTPHWRYTTERYGWWTRSTRGGTPTLRRKRSVQLVGLLSCCWHVFEFTYQESKTRITPKVKAFACCAMVRPWLGGTMHEPICIGGHDWRPS